MLGPVTMTAEKALEILRHSDTQNDSSFHGGIDLPWDVSPSDFLSFADSDLEETGGFEEQALINALSNAKRALHCQVDSILYALGLRGVTASWNLPRRLELLSVLGVATRPALARVNESRNVTEHEYAIPAESEVRLFLDVVVLFKEATEWYVAEHNWTFAGPESLSIQLKPQEEKILLNRGECEVHASDPLYAEILGLALRLARD